MTIFVIGINHETAPLPLREQIYFAKDKIAIYLQALITDGLVREAVLLSTCNRSELYCDADQLTPLVHWFCTQTETISQDALRTALYTYEGEAAVSHMMAVACGLNSMVLGESQILGQMKEAYAESVAADAIGSSFHRLFQHIFALAKGIRTTTTIGACPVSIASTAVYFAKKQPLDFANAHISVIGAGDTSQLLLRYLKKQTVASVSVVSRHLEKTAKLAKAFDVALYTLDQLEIILTTSDIVFSATSSAMPLITKTMIEEMMLLRAYKPLYFIDLAVPRDIATAVSTVPGVSLFCIDDLKPMIEEHKQGREHAAVKAREMIQAKSKLFTQELTSLDKTANTIRAYRHTIEEIGFASLTKAKQQLKQGMAPEEVIEKFAHAFTNKLLHVPSVQLRQAGAEGRFELLHYAKQLFAITDYDIETLEVESL